MKSSLAAAKALLRKMSQRWGHLLRLKIKREVWRSMLLPPTKPNAAVQAPHAPRSFARHDPSSQCGSSRRLCLHYGWFCSPVRWLIKNAFGGSCRVPHRAECRPE
jgi:hypothetical protein